MDHKLLALALYNTKKSTGGLGESTPLDAQDVIISILLKFVDVLAGVAVIIAGIFLIKIIKRYFAQIEIKHEQQKTAINLLEKITSGFLIVISVTLGLKVIGLDLTLIVSVLTLGVSFGLRDVIKNYVAGLLILFKAPFKLGDVVKIRKFIGKIEKIEFQSVTIRTFDRKEITVHNSDLLTQPIVNFSTTDQLRLEIQTILGYGSDVSRALKIFDQILETNPLVLKTPKYSVVFSGFKEQGTSILVRFWVKKPCNVLKVRSQLALQIQEAFDEARIFAPYAREAGLPADFGMTAQRKERLTVFYGQPALAQIAAQTIEQIATAALPDVQAQPAEVVLVNDEEEPE